MRQSHFFPNHALPSSQQPSGGRRGLLLALEAILFALTNLLILLGSYYSPSGWWSVACVGLFGWLSLLCLRAEPRGAVIAMPAIITHFSVVVAFIAIAFGGEIPELGMVGGPNIASATFIAYMAVLFGSFVLFFSFMRSRITAAPTGFWAFLLRYSSPIAIGIIGLAVFLALYMLAKGVQTGFPLLTGTDRFVMRRFYADKITVYGLNLKYPVAFALGLVAFGLPVPRLFRLGAILTFPLLTVTYFLYGDKFFTILGFAAGFFQTYLYINYKKVQSRIFTYVIAALIPITAVFSVTLFIYSDMGRASPEATLKKLSGRITGQAELWYLQTLVGADALTWNGDFVAKNFRALTIKDVDVYAMQEGIGPNYFSDLYSPNKIRNSLHRNAGSVTLTMALEPLGLATLGWIGLIGLMIGVGMFLALCSLYIALAIQRRSVLTGLLAAYVFTQGQFMMNQGTPYLMFSVFALKWFGCIVVIEILCAFFGLGLEKQKFYRGVARRRTTPKTLTQSDANA